MNVVMNKIHALLILPLLPIAVLIDLMSGDVVTKVKTPALEKLREHKQAWMDIWNSV